LNSIEKIKKKRHFKIQEKGKTNFGLVQPSSARPAARVRPLHLTGGSRLSAPVHARTLSLPLSLCPVGPTYRRQLPLCARPTLSMSRGPRPSVPRVVHPAPFLSLSVSWASLVSSIFPATAADPHPRARREDRPHRLPMRHSSFLSPACTRSLSPVSFRTRSPSLALCHRRSCSPEIHVRCSSHPACQ
jgi:hypothetical protein